MQTQLLYPNDPNRRAKQGPPGGWLGTALAVLAAAAITLAADAVAQPAANQAANALARHIPIAAVQQAAGYLTNHGAARPAELAPAPADGITTAGAGCLAAADRPPSGDAARAPQP